MWHLHLAGNPYDSADYGNRVSVQFHEGTIKWPPDGSEESPPVTHPKGSRFFCLHVLAWRRAEQAQETKPTGPMRA